jgi:hypothetical protein
MTDFNSFDPSKKNINNANLNPNRQGKGKEEAPAEGAEQQSAGDPYADLKMDPNKLMNILAAQAKQNASKIENVSVNSSVAAFSEFMSPERHSRLSRMFEQAYKEEFGSIPDEGTLQNILDDYIVGQPVIQA